MERCTIIIIGAGKACQVFGNFNELCLKMGHLTLGELVEKGFGDCPLVVK